MDTQDIASTLDGLGNPTRLDIFRLLVRAGGLPVGAIAARLTLTPSTLAFHLRCLVDCGLVHQEKRGRAVICAANLGKLHAILMLLDNECCRDIETDAAGETTHGHH
tara:strand:- start:11 stop:331 length:321 start_codon:yes stop_codon:yes gene_type:complete